LLNIYLPASLSPSPNIYFCELKSGWTSAIIADTPSDQRMQERFESRLAKS